MIEKNIPLSEYCHYKIGGKADYFCAVSNSNELQEAIEEFRELEPTGNIFIIGKGTNVLFSDTGYHGLVIKNEIDFIRETDGQIEAGSGALVSDIHKFCLEKGIFTLKWAGGLPGTIGGATFGNAGAFGGETKDDINKVVSLDVESLEQIERENSDCQFSYRSSIFKEKNGQEFIVSLVLKTEKLSADLFKQELDKNIDYRKTRQPLEYPSVGSTFKNVDLNLIPQNVQAKFKDKIKVDPFPIIPAAVFLAEAGLKGKTIGKVQISEKQPNFFINLGGGTAQDVKQLIDFAINAVKERFNVTLVPEVIEVK